MRSPPCAARPPLLAFPSLGPCVGLCAGGWEYGARSIEYRSEYRAPLFSWLGCSTSQGQHTVGRLGKELAAFLAFLVLDDLSVSRARLRDLCAAGGAGASERAVSRSPVLAPPQEPYACRVAVGVHGARLSAVGVFWRGGEIVADRREACVGPAGKLARKASKERKNKVLKVRGKAKAEVRSGKAVAKKKKD